MTLVESNLRGTARISQMGRKATVLLWRDTSGSLGTQSQGEVKA